MWICGLKDMLAIVRSSSYPDTVERWLRKEFYSIENQREMITLKELKNFFSKLNCKISTGKLLELFSEVDVKNRNEIGFDSFTKLYQKLLMTPHSMQDIFDRSFPYSRNGKVLTVHEFQQFLVNEQMEADATNLQFVANLIKDFLQDVQRDVHEPYFTIDEVN